jgi:hypothetical protein
LSINALDGAVVGESGVGLGVERGVGGVEGVGVSDGDVVRPDGGETRRSSTRFAVFLFISLVARQFPAMTEEVEFG